jgi:hypothetical protein
LLKEGYEDLPILRYGAKMDSIALFQKINNVGFKEAVEALNKI